MRVVVADASSLILMAKCAVLVTYARRVELVIAPAVRDEAASPALQQRHADAALIARAVEGGLLSVRAVTSRRKLPIALGPGEAATVHLCLQERADLVLSDDGRAIRTCRLLSIAFTTTPRVIVDLRHGGALSAADARRALEKLSAVGRYGNEIIAAALVALEEKRK